jgi:hypothetical protein
VKDILSARSFFILILIFSLLFGGIPNATISIDAFAKKSKTLSSDRVNGRGSDSRDEGSGTTSDSDKEINQLCLCQLKDLQIARL